MRKPEVIAGTLFGTDFRTPRQTSPALPLDAGAAEYATRFTSTGGLISVTPEIRNKMETVTPIRDLLFTLLLKVGVASSIAALLARWNAFSAGALHRRTRSRSKTQV